MEQRSMTVARALKTKNRLVERLGKARTTVRTYNSIRKELDIREHDVEQKMDESVILMKNLVALKTSIDRANQPIREKIYEMSELKAHIEFIRSVSTRRGKERSRYMAEVDEVEYEVTFTLPTLEDEVERTEARIDEIQAQLDDHNASTKVTVNFLKLPEKFTE